MTRRRPPVGTARRAADAALVALAGAVAVLVVAVLRSPVPPPTAVELSADARPTAVFVGDDALAARAGRAPGTSAADVAAGRLGWSATVEALVGSGFVAGSWSGSDTYRRQVEDLGGRPGPDVLVLLAGTGDRVHPPERVRAAAVDAVAAARSTLGLRTRLVLVGPVGSPVPAVAAQLEGVRAALREVARSERVHFLDPAGERWLAATTAFAPDGVRLTPEGDRLLGTRLAAALGRLVPA